MKTSYIPSVVGRGASGLIGLAHLSARSTNSFLKRHTAAIGSVVAVTGCGGEVVVTYDDGPSPDSTEEILEVLDKQRATATFFVLLTRARRFPEIISNIVSAGHEVALHGPDHQPFTAFRYGELRHRLRDARSQLADITGEDVKWVRPPYGRQTPVTWQAARAEGLVPVMWSATTLDSRFVSHAERVRRATEGINGGSILLAHDGFAGFGDGAHDGQEPPVDRVALITEILEEYRSRNLRGSSLGRALESGSLVKRAWFG